MAGRSFVTPSTPAGNIEAPGGVLNGILVPGTGVQALLGINIGTDANSNPYAVMPKSVARLIYQSAASVDVHASGTFTSALDVSQIGTLVVYFELLTLTGGASPGVQFRIEANTAFSSQVTIYTAAALTAAGNSQIITIGEATTTSGQNTQTLLPLTVNLLWLTGGAPATATARISVYGR